MKKLMLGVAILGGSACGQAPQRVYVGTTSTPEDSPSTSAAPSTTVEATTTTEVVAVAPEPIEPNTTAYVAPVTTRRATTTVTYYEPPSPQGQSTRRGDTPPEYIKQCESGGSYTAVNPNGHYGAWQFSQSTWESVGGTGRPDHATPAEQDYRASILWDGGNGASHWACA